ncbi:MULTISPECIES: tyrosinase family oxidase copper chaperone [unclassified Streptomyces]|uniref:tyrosinase family oxidase copper chaperone n=1 Tax=unclassified Streptomyces TaxID=2593676 RepID=UPI0016605CAC|nr:MULTISPECIES: tyrosinase family oxidase copper chaperone [unclassified Streptomyces]MBD0711664.1 tyrosinase co-factor protein [Streptomyces sp. CBMA291]MBD0713925.1 tyrosinase co-factor protein [Streptomyces sp. CBMA370]
MIIPRRVALRSLYTLAVTAFTGGALGRVAGRPPSGERPEDPLDPHAFDEMYRGRRVLGLSAPGGAPLAFVDGCPLHLMRCADGGYVTPIDHYETHPTPLAAVRATVDELGTAPLSPLAGAHGVHTAPTGGSPRGVHA